MIAYIIMMTILILASEDRINLKYIKATPLLGIITVLELIFEINLI